MKCPRRLIAAALCLAALATGGLPGKPGGAAAEAQSHTAAVRLNAFPEADKANEPGETNDATAPNDATTPNVATAPNEPGKTNVATAPNDALAPGEAGETGEACEAGEACRAALDAAFAKYRTLGACVAVFQNGRLTFTHCYGTLSPGGPAVTEDTVFQVGSISKMTANIGLMQLLLSRGLSLDSDLSTALGYPVCHPDFPDEPITFRQLMTHTAALRDSAAYDAAIDGDVTPLSALLESPYSYLRDQRPGTKRVYSNFGGGLTGSLIEALSGQTLDAYMQANVFGPLGVLAAFQPGLIPAHTPMSDMYLMPRKSLSRRLDRAEPTAALPDPETHYTYTAGKLIISAPDLCRLLIALCDGGVYGNARILPETAARELITPQNWTGSVACSSQNGLFMNILDGEQAKGRVLYGHGGRANGMLCSAYFDPLDRTGVVMLTNGCVNQSSPSGVGLLGREVTQICYDRVVGAAHRAEDPFLVE